MSQKPNPAPFQKGDVSYLRATAGIGPPLPIAPSPLPGSDNYQAPVPPQNMNDRGDREELLQRELEEVRHRAAQMEKAWREKWSKVGNERIKTASTFFRLIREKAALTKSLDQLQQEISTGQSKVDDIKQAKQEALLEVERLKQQHRDEVGRLSGDLEEESTSRSSMDRRLADLRQETERCGLERDNKKLQSQVRDLGDQLERRIHHASTIVDSDLKSLQAELIDKTKELSEVRHTNAKLKKSQQENVTELEHSRWRLDQYDVEVKKLRGRIEELKRDLATAEDESRKNPARVCRVVVVLLNGQKLEVMCDPSTTGQQLFEAVVTEIELPEFYFFGLTYVSDNEHFFITADQKLHKVAPSGWRDSWKGPGANVTFTVHLRVKFYVDNVAALKHETTRHQLYLQLRRDILEGRCQCPENKALALAGLALQAEYGDYSPATHARGYLVPEQYYPGAVVRRLGAAYILDNTPAAHRDGAGLSEVEAELEFIKLVQEQLPEYGVHFHKLLKRKKDTSDTIWVGVNVNQLVLADTSGHDRVIVHRHTWPSIMKISFNRRRFSVQPRPDVGQLKPTKLNFYTTSYRKGQYLMKFCTVQHSFQLKMKSRLAGHDTIPGIEGVEGTSIGGTEDMDSSGTDNEGTVVDDQVDAQTNSARRVQRSNDELQEQVENLQMQLEHVQSRLRRTSQSIKGSRSSLHSATLELDDSGDDSEDT